jgi:hypothetical protein
MTKTTARILVSGWLLLMGALATVLIGEQIEWLWTHPWTFIAFWSVAGSFLASRIRRREHAARTAIVRPS